MYATRHDLVNSLKPTGSEEQNSIVMLEHSQECANKSEDAAASLSGKEETTRSCPAPTTVLIPCLINPKSDLELAT